MKKLIHKKWLSIPVTVFLVLALTAGAVFANGVTHLSETQTITQNIEAPSEYGSIDAPGINLNSVEIGKSFSKSFPDAVVLELGSDGVGKYLHLYLDEASASLYTSYRVQISSYAIGGNPMGTAIFCTVGYGEAAEGPHMSWGPLTEMGTYTFSGNINGTAGSTAGPATVEVTYTLEDNPAAVNVGP